MKRWWPLLAGVLLLIAALRACSTEPQCQDDPAFYLKGTAIDCAVPS